MRRLSMEVSDYYTGKDHFIVEDLFNFSNDEAAAVEGNGAFDAVDGGSTDSSNSTVTAGDGNGSTAFGYGQHFSTDFYQPCEEVAELEWLSNFMEDCFSNKDHPKPSQFSNTANSSSSGSAQFTPSTSNQVTARSARSKRSRANPTNWASRIPILTPSESAPRSRDSTEVASDGCRRCLHCGSEKTPQWRMGPMGPKTLCNACGVRYKSGRLVPEYRPAASPTFVVSEHSNSHRKVVELRRQKEMMQKQQQVLFWP